MGNSGKGLGVVALLIAIGALGLSGYQFLLPLFSADFSEGSIIYSDTYNNKFNLNDDTNRTIPNLIVNYTTSASDSVLLEFCCQVSMEITGVTYIIFFFEIDGSPPSPYAEMSVRGDSSDTVLHIPFTMSYYIESSSAGMHVLKVMTYIDVDGTTSFLRYCVLTATVY